MTPQQQLQVALKDLEDAGWHVRCHEKWIVEGNERRRRVVEHFFFCSPWQIDMSRRFISEFCVVTDATFNTNHLNMPLSTLVGRSNLEEAFRAAFCYVSSESKEAFAFVFECLKELFFHDACPGPAVIVGDFALGLSAAMCKRRGITQADGGVEAMREIAELDVVGTDVQLQLCSWHAVEAIRRRLTKEAYPKEVREELHHLLWMWIQTEDVVDLPTNRAAVIDRLREKERTYFAEQYQRMERNFVLCYTKQYANLGIKSTQMGESSHNTTKEDVSRHTPISQSVKRVREGSDRAQADYEKKINKQVGRSPVYLNGHVFQHLKGKLTHPALNRLTKELAATHEFDKAIEAGEATIPEEDKCGLQCSLPRQFKLPCKCFLLPVMRQGRPVPMSLIHPRWLLKAPEEPRRRRWRMRIEDEEEVPSPPSSPADAAEPPVPVGGDVYVDKGAYLIESSILKTMEYHSKLPAHKAEEFAKQKAKVEARFLQDFQAKEAAKNALPVAFPDIIQKEQNLKWKKGQSRRKRALTSREKADLEEAETRRRRRAKSIEVQKSQKHAGLMQTEAQLRVDQESQDYLAGYSQLSDFTDEPEYSHSVSDPDFDIPSVTTKKRREFDPEVEKFIDLDTFPSGSPPGNSGFSQNQPLIEISSESSDSEAPEAIDVDSDQSGDDLPTVAAVLSQTAFKPPASTAPAKLGGQERLSQIPHATAGPTGRVRKKSKQQLKLESQQRADATKKAEAKTAKEARAVKKKTKQMAPRKEDVSQLADQFKILSSSPPVEQPS